MENDIEEIQIVELFELDDDIDLVEREIDSGVSIESIELEEV